MRVELFLAGRYLRPKRNMVSLFTVFSLIGVMLGVAVVMIVLAVMTGFTDKMKSKLIDTQAHFQVRVPGNRSAIRDHRPIVREIEKAGAEAAPGILQPVLVQYKVRIKREGAPDAYAQAFDARGYIIGVDRDILVSKLKLDKSLKAGRLEYANDENALDNRGIIIGEAMAKRLRLKVGDKIILHSSNRLLELVKFSPDGSVRANDSGSAYVPPEFTVTGIYSLGKYDFDNTAMFVDYGEAADLFNLRYTNATCVFGWGRDAFDQQKLIAELRRSISDHEVVTWEENNRPVLEVLNVEKRMMFFLLIFIVLVAAFSIANTLITSVYQKTREIGLLKALGATDGAITGVFLLQGTLIGVIGSVAGVALGTLVITFRNHILQLVSRWTGSELFPKEFYYFNELPAHIVPQDVAFIVVSSVVLCTLGALLPAWRAARLDPAKALRYE
ncbi:MAG: ABC transporter permease [Lentisphaeria bacterium]|nr:ABC transporter permease [Lentisphaeria bacterium]